MADLTYLDSRSHSDLRLDLANAANRHFVQVVAEEMPVAANEYPIFFTKNPQTGSFYAGVVMGLEAGTNLYAANGELPGYRPADLVRQGFFLSDGQIAIDPESPAFIPDGKPIFDERGEATPVLQAVQRAMHMLEKGLPETDAILARFVEHRLLEPIDISLDFDDGSRLRLDGLYSTSLDALHSLPDAVALELFRNGDLQIAYIQAASINHIRRLAKIRNDRLLAATS
ncbi:hypothetical protein FHS61_001063 [Altererythrobacter atlanticus]|uniref:SapC n=1 Tax=Croceibacterium atlanticum TaxID=1267766 RepID=A0A0F7KWQ6_9SPHN|nr:SapC family protein [Croceibacterium atlanticum]AKH43235.1 SapC [Croceibacterium atlanticum]MBB5732059.1 hypothetical protein [Croceibacterium atlanticum]